MPTLNSVKTLAIVMMENRSFDHMLGYLSLLDPTMKVDGLIAPQGSNVDYRVPLTKLENDSYLNVSSADGALHYPFHMKDDPLTTDVPHDRHSVETQLAEQPATGYAMSGFVDAYYSSTPTRMDLADPMGFFTAAEVPMMNFFARNFGIFDRWFTPIPTDTQPNRLMALNAETNTDKTAGLPPDQDLVLDWLTRNNIDWRVYSDDLSFFTVFPRLWPDILTSNRFQKFSSLTRDVLAADRNNPRSFPQVIFIEPSFLDSPIHPDHEPNDDHPPLQVGFGEDFLRQVYQALTPPANLTVWNQLVMVVSFDEHGGFYDHVPPLFPVNQNCGPGNPPFSSTGPRVPAFIVSPFVNVGEVFNKNFDHTSVLEFLAEWLTPGSPYSALVTNRLAQAGFNAGNGRGRFSDSLTLLQAPRTQPPNEPLVAMGGLRLTPGKKAARTPNEIMFEQAVRGMVQKYPNEVAAKYPELLHWRQNS
jgi:phospholipase C